MNPLLRILLESSLRISAAAVLVGLALSLARIRASSVRHAAWTAVLCAMLLMPAPRTSCRRWWFTSRRKR